MSKRRQGPINKRLDFINNKLNKLHKKIHSRNTSILVGATIFVLTMKQKRLKKIIWKILL